MKRIDEADAVSWHARRFLDDAALKKVFDVSGLKTEYETIVNSGFILQIDCPDLAMERHTSFAGKPPNEFLDFIDLVVSAINGSIVNLPREKVRMHVCWGNYEGPHNDDVPLEQPWDAHDKITGVWGPERKRIKQHHVFLRLLGDEKFLYAGKAHLGSYPAAQAAAKAQQHAQIALEAADREHSGFRYHPRLEPDWKRVE